MRLLVRLHDPRILTIDGVPFARARKDTESYDVARVLRAITPSFVVRDRGEYLEARETGQLVRAVLAAAGFEGRPLAMEAFEDLVSRVGPSDWHAWTELWLGSTLAPGDFVRTRQVVVFETELVPVTVVRKALESGTAGRSRLETTAEFPSDAVRSYCVGFLGDVPLITAHTLEAVMQARAGSAALAFATMTLENPEGYGRVVHAPGRGPALVVEEKDATPEERSIKEVNAGLYCADAAFLWSTLGKVRASNAQGEFYLTDLVALAAEGPGAVAAKVSATEAMGVNDQKELSLAARALTRPLATSLMESGVTIEDPERFDCDEGVEVGPDTVLEPSVRLKGATRIGGGCRIGPG